MQQLATTTALQNHKPTCPAPNTLRIATRNTREQIETVRAHNPIEQVIGRYIELRPSGRRLVGRCPFHDDPTPSLVVYMHNQSWYCFGCDVGGDVFKFVQLIERVPFAEALKLLSGPEGVERVEGRRLGSNTVTTRPASHAIPVRMEASPNVELSDEHFTLLTAATEVYHAAIFTQPRVLEYLARRRIDLDMIRRHHIGFATGNDLAKCFRFRGWDPEIGNDLGLIGPHGEYFRQRIVIPELRDGRAIYLVGRATQRYQRAKYLGLPGAPKPLYGIKTIQHAKDVFVCKGPMDWLTLVKWDYPAIALLGSHLKQDQISEIADAERIFIVTDSDEPGRKCARQLAETFGQRARIVPPLPNAKDVNELSMCQQGEEIFATLVYKAG